MKTRSGSVFNIFVLFALLTSLLGSAVDVKPAYATGTTFTVNGATDAVDANLGDTVCETAPSNGICTLRAAIQESNALAGADTINLPPGIYTLTIPGVGEDVSAAGDLHITDDLTIN